MSYSRICQKEYYLLWDSDTIPIKPIKMFEKRNPIFDMQNDYYLHMLIINFQKFINIECGIQEEI